MPQYRNFKQYDAVKVYAPDKDSPFYVIGRIIGYRVRRPPQDIESNTVFSIMEDMVRMTRHHVIEDRLRNTIKNPPFCPSNSYARSYIQDSYEKKKEITNAD